MKNFRVFFLAIIFLASPLLQVARCQSDSKEKVSEMAEGGDIGIVGEDAQDFCDGTFSPAPGVDTVCIVPKNSARLVTAGEETELLVGLKNDAESSTNVIAIQASVRLPFDHRLLVQNLSAQDRRTLKTIGTGHEVYGLYYLRQQSSNTVCSTITPLQLHKTLGHSHFSTLKKILPGLNNATVKASVQATFPYIFAVSKYLQKTKARKVEVGTGTTNTSMDEWLQGTAYTRSLSNKSKKK